MPKFKRCTRVEPSQETMLRHAGLMQRAGRKEKGLAASKRFYWKNKAQLKVFFREQPPYPSFNADVLELASEWSQHGSITFTETQTEGEADISVALGSNAGMWSYIGTKSKAMVADGFPSMNLDPTWGLVEGFMDSSTVSDRYLRSTIQHEFGHALGFIHEHQRGDRPFTWDIAWMKANLNKLGLDGWASVRQNYIAKVMPKYLLKGDFDYKSIMSYSWNRNATVEKIGNSVSFDISAKDKAKMGEIYP